MAIRTNYNNGPEPTTSKTGYDAVAEATSLFDSILGSVYGSSTPTEDGMKMLEQMLGSTGPEPTIGGVGINYLLAEAFSSIDAHQALEEQRKQMRDTLKAIFEGVDCDATIDISEGDTEGVSTKILGMLDSMRSEDDGISDRAISPDTDGIAPFSMW